MEWAWDRGTGEIGEARTRKYDIDLLSLEGDRGPVILCEGCSLGLPSSGYTVSDTPFRFEASQGGLTVRKDFAFDPATYLLTLHLTIENGTNSPFRGRLGLGWGADQLPGKPSGIFSFLKGPQDRRTFVYQSAGKILRNGEATTTEDLQGQIAWTGIEDRYFLIALISRKISSDQLLRLRTQGSRLEMALYPSEVTILPGNRHEELFSIYLGPKEREALQTAGVGLEKAVDYGWFSLIAIPILKLLQLFHAVVRNWGIAIILLTLFAKLLMNPLTVKSMRQMKEMQRLQPKMAELKEKFKNDRQRLNTETMQLFKTHKVNPMGGCLPMLLQMPIYIALYKVLYNAIELYRAPFFWFYKDLSAPDPYFILPILLGVSMVLQQKMTPATSADPAQRQMMMIMPVMFTVFMLFLPLGLVLYIFVNTVASVLQQWKYTQGISWKDLLSLKKLA